MAQTWTPFVMLLIKGKCVFWTVVQWYVERILRFPCFMSVRINKKQKYRLFIKYWSPLTYRNVCVLGLENSSQFIRIHALRDFHSSSGCRSNEKLVRLFKEHWTFYTHSNSKCTGNDLSFPHRRTWVLRITHTHVAI